MMYSFEDMLAELQTDSYEVHFKEVGEGKLLGYLFRQSFRSRLYGIIQGEEGKHYFEKVYLENFGMDIEQIFQNESHVDDGANDLPVGSWIMYYEIWYQFTFLDAFGKVKVIANHEIEDYGGYDDDWELPGRFNDY